MFSSLRSDRTASLFFSILHPSVFLDAYALLPRARPILARLLAIDSLCAVHTVVLPTYLEWITGRFTIALARSGSKNAIRRVLEGKELIFKLEDLHAWKVT